MTPSIIPCICLKTFFSRVLEEHCTMEKEHLTESTYMTEDAATGVNALLQRVAKRDVEALNHLYDEFSGLLMSVILPIVKNQAEAEDVLQDSYITIWNKAGMYQPNLGKPTSWIVTVAKNKAYDRYRKLVRKSEGMRDFQESVNNQPEVHLPESDSESLEGCFQKLNRDQQSAVSLVFYKGFTQQEASAELDAPLGTVKARIRRGLIQLKKCLSNT